MHRIALFLLTAGLLAGADDPWAKVQELKSHTELRIYQRGSSEPLNATFDEADSERILIVAKNKQMAIPKEKIDRIDARPATKTPRKVSRESTAKTVDPDFTPQGPHTGAPAPSTSYSNNISVGGGKPDFETVYRRTASAPKE